MLCDERRGDEFWHVIPRFATQVAAVSDLEERLVIHRVRLARKAADLPLDAAGAGVIGRRREIDAPQPLHQILQVIHGGLGGLERIAPLIHPGVDLQAVAAARRRHELPHPDSSRATDRRVRQTAFDEREIHEVLWQASRAQLLADHSFIAAQAGQPDREAITGVELEELEVLEDPAVTGEA